ncbi:hypothetical protein FWF74_00960 [Candidatus Saccharibacteria bacterium]|nr:hypothetical protein [Candidatus Saccharibacteria bacterium]MCL1963241.1 hypothetical protein [Candidatus Saccharibacteria bacterium]
MRISKIVIASRTRSTKQSVRNFKRRLLQTGVLAITTAVTLFCCAYFPGSSARAYMTDSASLLGHPIVINIYDSTCESDPDAEGCQTPDPDCTTDPNLPGCSPLNPNCVINPHAQDCPNPNPDPPTPLINKPTPPDTNAGSTWTFTLLNKNYAVPVAPFIVLFCSAILAIGLCIFLIQKHIKEKGIGGVKVKNPWGDYQLTYEKVLAKKHENDPLTEIVDVSQIVKKYRIKFVLWHTVPVVAITLAFFMLFIITAPIMADVEDIETDATNDPSTTYAAVLDIDKKTAPDNYSIDAEELLTVYNHKGTAYTWVGARYEFRPTVGQTIANFATLRDHLTITSDTIELTGFRCPITPVFHYDFSGAGTVDAPIPLNIELTGISDIDTGTYNIDIVYQSIAIQKQGFANATEAFAALASGCIRSDY